MSLVPEPVGKELFQALGVTGLVVIQGRSQRRRWEGSGDGGVRRVRDSRNSMETSSVSRGRNKTAVRLGKVPWGPCGPGGGTAGAPRFGFGQLGVTKVFSSTSSQPEGWHSPVHQQRGAHA